MCRITSSVSERAASLREVLSDVAVIGAPIVIVTRGPRRGTTAPVGCTRSVPINPIGTIGHPTVAARRAAPE